MYGVDELRQAIENPHVVLRELNRLYHRRLLTRSYNTDGFNVFDADWDTLILLDACRFDTFEAHADLPGTLSKRVSRGAATPEFIRANFADQKLHDTIYVSRNTWFLKLSDQIDAEVFDFRLTSGKSPEETTEVAVQAVEDHPHKRLIVHYLPPHHPFLGPTAEEWFPDYEAQSADLFEQIQCGEIDLTDELLRQAYIENLDRVLSHVEQLFAELSGKTVVTADHGELLGDRCRPIPVTDYGHHTGLYVDELVEVPWLVYESGERRTITADHLSRQADYDVDKIDERLRDLGYRV